MKKILITILCMWGAGVIAQSPSGVDSTLLFPTNQTTPMNAKFYKFMNYLRNVKDASVGGRVFVYDSSFFKGHAYSNITPGASDSGTHIANTEWVKQRLAGYGPGRDTITFKLHQFTVDAINAQNILIGLDTAHTGGVVPTKSYGDSAWGGGSGPQTIQEVYNTGHQLNSPTDFDVDGNNFMIWFDESGGDKAIQIDGGTFTTTFADGGFSVRGDSARITAGRGGAFTPGTDTTKYKPVGISNTGALTGMKYWYGSGGGGSPFLPLGGTGTATGDITGDLDGNNLTILQNSGHYVQYYPDGRLFVGGVTDGSYLTDGLVDANETGLYYGASDEKIATYNSGTITYKYGNSALNVDGATGNVGIGTSTPTEKLHVNSGNILVTGGKLIAPNVISSTEVKTNVDWTGVAGTLYIASIDASQTFTFPASPSDNDIIKLVARNFSGETLTIDGNGKDVHDIDGSNITALATNYIAYEWIFKSAAWEMTVKSPQ